MPGPVPKRSAERRRRNKTGVTSAVVGSIGGSVQPAGDPRWHSIAAALWEALGESGQAQFYEPSDWAFAFSLMDDLSYYKSAERRSGQMLQSIYSAFERLLVTEGDRRRARLELERADSAPVDDENVAIMDDYRRMAD
ncbi:hypothetical protein 7S3_1 [uncultured Caudovirales phage]|uniref:Terminase small subunit n=1 Tax=uncultured Caudovirales phage TaxID=2100421 RepID=A0A2H4J3S7_9CAUD|nr:hypothetical protein 7S3_1 [uncultured Caudovirales phage]